MVEFEPEELTANLLASVPDMAYILDMEGRLAWWNDRVNAVTGYTDEELAGRNVFNLLVTTDRPEAKEAFENVESFGAAATKEFEVITKDGRRLPHEFNGSMVEFGGERFVFGIGRDVTERYEWETAIRRQRDELETLNHVSETVYEAIQAVVDAASREELEEEVCERLTESELYRSVWIARDDPGETVEPRAGTGRSEDFLETVRSVNDLDYTRYAKRALDTGQLQVVQRIPEADMPEGAREAAAKIGVKSAVWAPISYRGKVLGVLSVHSSRPEAFNEREQAAFRRLGEVIGFAINAVQTERLLLSNTTTELTFRISSSDAFLATVSSEADGPCRHEWSTPEANGRYRHYVTVSGMAPERVVAIGEATPNVKSIAHVGDNAEAHVFEIVTKDSFMRRLLENGASPTAIVAEDGESRVVAELPGEADVRPVVEAATELYGAELVSKRELERPVRTADEFHDAVTDKLSDRQQKALRQAFLNGYFSWPRDATAEEIAETMGITSPTFHYHIRRAERALVEAYFQHLDG